jgi:cell division protein FtsW (lipid II flippase)
MLGELAAFLTIAALVTRRRPDVPHFGSDMPTYAFPSRHTAATTCLYVGIAILVIGHARVWWRYLFLVLAIVMPVMIALARVDRGAHHPHRHPWQPAVRRALADRHHDAHQAGHARTRPRWPPAPGRAQPKWR